MTNTAPSRRPVGVLLYPGCIFFEIALAAEVLAGQVEVRYYTLDGLPGRASNGARIEAAGSYAALEQDDLAAVLVPGGDPRSILRPDNLVRAALTAQAGRSTLMAGICAGNLVLAACGLLRGRRGTHNYTLEYASPEKVAATRDLWDGMQFVRADLVQDGPVITAQAWAYRPYAAAVAEALGVLTPQAADELRTYVERRSYGHGEAAGDAPATAAQNRTSAVTSTRRGSP